MKGICPIDDYHKVCSVCEEIDGDMLILVCGHKVHKACILEWNNMQCPFCSKDMKSSVNSENTMPNKIDMMIFLEIESNSINSILNNLKEIITDKLMEIEE